MKRRRKIRGKFRYFPTWSLDELIVARPILDPNLKEDEVRYRYFQFGGVPRHIFEAKEDIEDILLAQDRAIQALSSEKAIAIALCQMNAFDGFGKEAKSAVLAFRLSADDNGTFEKGESYIVSELVSEKINSKFQSSLWNNMLNLGTAGGGTIIFEMITRHMIANGKPPREFQCRPCVGIRNKEYKNYSWQILGTGKHEIRQVIDPLAAAKSFVNILFHPISPKHELFDFVYQDFDGHFHFFQVTLGKKHTANSAAIKNVEEKVGDASKLSFYFLVPSSNFPKFVTDPVNPKEKVGISCNIFHVSIPNPDDQLSGATDNQGRDGVKSGMKVSAKGSKGKATAKAMTKCYDKRL